MMASRRAFWSLPRQLLGCVLLVVLLQVVPAARDEAKLKGRLSKCGVAGIPPLVPFLAVFLFSSPSYPRPVIPPPFITPYTAESLVIVNQARAIQQLANELSDGLTSGDKVTKLALIGAQARTAARAVLEVLTDGRGCLQWNAAQLAEQGDWVTSTGGVRDSLVHASQAVGVNGELVVVVEHMEKLDCGNLMHLNSFMLAMDSGSALKAEGSLIPTFLFLFEKDPPRRALLDGGIRSHLLEAIDQRCHPEPGINLRAFFGRLEPITLAPLPEDASPDTRPLCSTLPGGGRGGRGLWGLPWPFNKAGDLSLTNKLLAVAAMSLSTYALVRAATAAARQRDAAESTPVTPTSGSGVASSTAASSVPHGGELDECMTGTGAVETLMTTVRGGKGTPARATRRHAAQVGTDEAGVKATNGGIVKPKKATGKRAASPKPTGRRTPK